MRSEIDVRRNAFIYTASGVSGGKVHHVIRPLARCRHYWILLDTEAGSMIMPCELHTKDLDRQSLQQFPENTTVTYKYLLVINVCCTW